jgi:hypothetical protein
LTTSAPLPFSDFSMTNLSTSSLFRLVSIVAMPRNGQCTPLRATSLQAYAVSTKTFPCTCGIASCPRPCSLLTYYSAAPESTPSSPHTPNSTAPATSIAHPSLHPVSASLFTKNPPTAQPGLLMLWTAGTLAQPLIHTAVTKFGFGICAPNALPTPSHGSRRKSPCPLPPPMISFLLALMTLPWPSTTHPPALLLPPF